MGHVLGGRLPRARTLSSPFELCLFATDPQFIRGAVRAGVDSLVVDWEHIGKSERQRGANTQINRDSVDDLRRVHASTRATVICRINAVGPWTSDEVEEAERVLALVDGRIRVGILVETVAACRAADALGRLPLSRVYVGLNDLAIERGTPSIFTAIADGTLARIRRQFDGPFGFGGLTLPDRGLPIPCRLLIGEMARLECTYSFLRRSFYADIRGRDARIEIPRIRAAVVEAAERTPAKVAQDHRELYARISALDRERVT